MKKPKALRRNPDGSYEGFVDSATANRMLLEFLEQGTECAVRAVQKKDADIKRLIREESGAAQRSY